jgi:hypothetical protein
MPHAEVGTKLVFDKEQVNVWERTFGPGEEIDAHTNDPDDFVYPIEGGTLEVRRGTRLDQATLEAGKVDFRRGGDTDGARNIGATPDLDLFVELKAPR